MTFEEWRRDHFADGITPYQEYHENDLKAAYHAARQAALQEAANVAIKKGVGNGHLETCAFIADAIRSLAATDAGGGG